MATFKPGDRIRYSRAFLQAICDFTRDSAIRAGTVVLVEPELRPNGPCPVMVHWDDIGPLTKRVLSTNLAPA